MFECVLVRIPLSVLFRFLFFNICQQVLYMIIWGLVWFIATLPLVLVQMDSERAHPLTFAGLTVCELLLFCSFCWTTGVNGNVAVMPSLATRS